MISRTDWDGMAKLTEAFFGKRNQLETKCKVTFGELLRRGVSHVSTNGKLYRVEVKEVTFDK